MLGQKKIDNDPKSGTTKLVTTDNQVENIYHMIVNDKDVLLTNRFQADPVKLFGRFLTQDETCVHYFDHESKIHTNNGITLVLCLSKVSSK